MNEFNKKLDEALALIIDRANIRVDDAIRRIKYEEEKLRWEAGMWRAMRLFR